MGADNKPKQAANSEQEGNSTAQAHGHIHTLRARKKLKGKERGAQSWHSRHAWPMPHRRREPLAKQDKGMNGVFWTGGVRSIGDDPALRLSAMLSPPLSNIHVSFNFRPPLRVVVKRNLRAATRDILGQGGDERGATLFSATTAFWSPWPPCSRVIFASRPSKGGGGGCERNKRAAGWIRCEEALMGLSILPGPGC